MNKIDTTLLVSGLFGTIGVSTGAFSLLQPFRVTALYGVPSPPPFSSELPPSSSSYAASVSSSNSSGKRRKSSKKSSSSSTAPYTSSSSSSYSVSVPDASYLCTIAFVRAKAVRDLSAGLAILGLGGWLRNQKALGVLLIAQSVSSAVDGAVVHKEGIRRIAYAHWLSSAIFAGTGAWLIWFVGKGAKLGFAVAGKKSWTKF